jgi:lysozyme
VTLFEQLERHEGRRKFPYVDTVGKVSIGVGRNLKDRGLSDDEIDYLLSNDLKECRDDLATFPWWDELDEVRRNVVMDMRFQLGAAGFRKFKATLGAVAAGNYTQAGEYMEASRWARQVPNRAARLIRWMKTGVSDV